MYAPRDMKNILWNLRNLRDFWPFVAMIVIAALLFYFVSWWMGFIGLVAGYFYFGQLTYMQVITAIQRMTGLDYYRANKIYKAGITGDGSEIKTSELQVPGFDSGEKGPQRKLKEQLVALIMKEPMRRDIVQEWESFLPQKPPDHPM
jgi:hypothetical protein